MTGILFQVPQEIAAVISQTNGVLVSTAEVWVSAGADPHPAKELLWASVAGERVCLLDCDGTLRLVNNLLEGCQERIL